MSDFWTEKKIKTLKELVENGLTFSQIGRQLGCTRNAAVAKAHRMGWRGTPIAQIVFKELDEPTQRPYRGKYQGQASGPQVARLNNVR